MSVAVLLDKRVPVPIREGDGAVFGDQACRPPQVLRKIMQA